MSAEQQTPAAEAPQMGPITREEDAEEWEQRAKELFRALPMPSIRQLMDGEVFDVSKYQHKPETTPAEGVQNCADAVEKDDAEECKAYREEIDTLLVFAGLFSAAVTAFTIESYQWLQSDPNDAIIALLSQIAHPADQTQSPAAQTGLSGAVSAQRLLVPIIGA